MSRRWLSLFVALAVALFAVGAAIADPLPATTQVSNGVIANPSMTVNGTTCTLGSSCSPGAAAGSLTGSALASGVTSAPGLTSAAGGSFGPLA